MSSLKLVLRVPKDQESAGTSTENDYASSQNNADNDEDDDDNLISENSNSCLAGNTNSITDENSFLNFSSLEPKNATTNAETLSQSLAKKRKRKKRFKFTIPNRSSKVKRKPDDETSNDKDAKKKPLPTTSISEDTILADLVSGGTVDQKAPEKTPLQILCTHMIKYLEKKDPESYFLNPVDDEIAPGYSDVIKCPMDFSTIMQKIDKDAYESLTDFKTDVELVYKNARTYNQPGTVHHVAAEKLRAIVEFLFGKEKLLHTLRTLNLVNRIPASQLGCELAKKEHVKEKKSKHKLYNYACIVDDMSADDVLVQTTLAAETARAKLASRRPHCKTAFIDMKKDGTSTLKFLIPEHVADSNGCSSNEAPEERQFCLADIIPKLKEGTPGLSMPPSNPLHTAVPYTTLDYGEFSSFAPYFDSTWSTLTKEESSLLLTALNNDKTCVDYVDSLRRFTRNTSDHMIQLVDGMLDALTHGEYSRVLKANNEAYSYDDLGEAVAEDNLPISCEKDKPADHTVFENKADQLLADNCSLLSDLQKIQYQRLSQPPPFVITDAAGPDQEEVKVAQLVLTNLQSLTSQAAPSEVVSTKSVRSLMGVTATELMDASTNDSEECDMEVFNEFFQF